MSIPLYRDNQPVWRQGVDSGGSVDIVAVELAAAALPQTILLSSFTPVSSRHRVRSDRSWNCRADRRVSLGFHDNLHHLPVARQAVIASAFGIRFQGQGYFLTDARMHRGTSGAPVVARVTTERSGRADFPWMLLGVHAARMDVSNRDIDEDERLDLNCAWYADVLLTLTDESGVMAGKTVG